eukprot:1147422-Pelagomonas_calceolata.AAC.2
MPCTGASRQPYVSACLKLIVDLSSRQKREPKAPPGCYNQEHFVHLMSRVKSYLAGPVCFLVLDLLCLLSYGNAARELLQPVFDIMMEDLPTAEDMEEGELEETMENAWKPWAAAFRNTTLISNATSGTPQNDTAISMEAGLLNNSGVLPNGTELSVSMLNDTLLNATMLDGTAANLTTDGNFSTIKLR